MFDAIDAAELKDSINSLKKYDKAHNCYIINPIEIIDEINNQTRKRCTNCFRYDEYTWCSWSGVECEANGFCDHWIQKDEK